MSRTIKFQAFIPDLKIILTEVYPCGDDMIGVGANKLEEQIKGKFQIYDDEIYDLSEDFNKIMSVLCGDDWYWFEKGEYELRQYTGLVDKNGVEIFEGDIIKYNNLTGIVVYEERMFACWDIDSNVEDILDYRSGALMVIGNKWQNGELLLKPAV